MDSFSTRIEPKRGLLELDLKEIWKYRDLLRMFVKRDVITVYKQTILGPVWYVIQPILTTAIYVLVFGQIAGISTDGQPQVLFYLSGIIIWNFFAGSFSQTSKTFMENAGIFSKVYFPRLILPLSKLASGLIRFTIQFAFLVVVYIIYILKGYDLNPSWTLALLPVFLLLLAVIGMGAGIIFTSLTTKYRDLNFLIAFGVQLLMYATPVIYPVSTIPARFRMLILANPLTSVVEAFKYSLLGKGAFSWTGLAYSMGFAVMVIFLGLLVFQRTEKNFIDTV